MAVNRLRNAWEDLAPFEGPVPAYTRGRGSANRLWGGGAARPLGPLCAGPPPEVKREYQIMN